MTQYCKSDFFYTLPENLIARYPLIERSSSRLLVADVQVEKMTLIDSTMRQFIDYLNPGDLLVLNNTRVLPARLQGKKDSGGKVEIMVERCLDMHRVRAFIRASKSPAIESRLQVGNYHIIVSDKRDGLYTLESVTTTWETLLTEQGKMPIPPYLARVAEALDDTRYQTVFAKKPGAVAAPTAGLHFDTLLLQSIVDKGIALTEITLHVGAGTFQPVREENLQRHIMHEEWFSVSVETVKAIQTCKQQGGRVIAIGTTSLRAIESAAQNGELVPCAGDTNLFITPGYQFRVIDGLLTNFHLPESTLLMLVSAFAGLANIQFAYQHAIAQGYRFYSYGDAMFFPHKL